MPPSIPFLRLPPVPQLLILEYLSLFQLFEFSFLSKRASQIAKSRKRNVEDLHWSSDYPVEPFRLGFNDYDNNHFQVSIKFNCYKNATGEISFEGRQLSVARNDAWDRSQSIHVVVEPEEDLSELIEKLTEHALAMLNVETYDFCVGKAADLTKCPLWKYTRTLKRFWTNVWNTDDVLSASEMEFVLGELTITDMLRIDSKVAEGFQWTEPLNTEEIHLNDGRFLSLDVYLNSKVKKWKIDYDTFPTTYLNAIMKTWLDGGLDQLKSFSVGFPSDDEERNKTLEGIQTFPWDPAMRRRMWNNIDASGGRDMRRGDGKLATAVLSHRKFRFVVWGPHQMHPDPNEDAARYAYQERLMDRRLFGHRLHGGDFNWDPYRMQPRWTF